ncbi:MAG: hypothetical protein ACTSP5_09295, partial [Candidatus Heimdallarchaeota archaeon]
QLELLADGEFDHLMCNESLLVLQQLIDQETELVVKAAAKIVTSWFSSECPKLGDVARNILISNKELAGEYTEELATYIHKGFDEFPPSDFHELLSIIEVINPAVAKEIAWKYSDYENYDRNDEDWGANIRYSCYDVLFNLGEISADFIITILRYNNSDSIRGRAIEALSKISDKTDIPLLYIIATGFIGYFYSDIRGMVDFQSGFEYFPKIEEAVMKAFENIGVALDKKKAIIATLDYYLNENEDLESIDWYLEEISKKHNFDPNEIIGVYLDRKLTDREIRLFLNTVIQNGTLEPIYSDETVIKMFKKLPEATEVWGGVFDDPIDFGNRNKEKIKNVLQEVLRTNTVYKDNIKSWFKQLN